MIADFSWKYSSDAGRGVLQINNYPKVRFDTSRPRIAKWMTAKHMRGMIHEPAFTYVLWRLIVDSKPKIYFDVGSFLGYFTVLPLPWLPLDSQVYAFEMNPASITLLQANVRANRPFGVSRVFVVNCGISDRVSYAKDMFVKGFILRDATAADPDVRRIPIDILTLDHIYTNFGISPNLIKMDIEGFEALAFAGARKLLAEKGPMILFELHGNNKLAAMSSTREKVILELEELGYEVTAVRENRHGALDSDRPLERLTSTTRARYMAGVNTFFVAARNEGDKLIISRLLGE